MSATAQLPARTLRRPLLVMAAVLVASLLASPTPAAAQTGRPLAAVLATKRTDVRPGTADPGIQLGLAFDYNAANSLSAAREVSYIFGGYFLDWNFGFYPSGPHLDGYLPFDVDPYPQTSPGHSLSDWQQTHPDWIVYRCDRVTPASYGNGNTTTTANVPLDFSNPAVRAWQVQEAEALLRDGAQGIALDDFDFENYAGRCGVYRNGLWTPLGYPSRGGMNGLYTSEVMGDLEYMSSQLKQAFPTSTIAVNASATISGLEDIEAITPFIDTDFDEAGFTDYGEKNLSGSAWLQEVKAVQYLNQHGRGVDLNGIVAASSDATVTHAEINWVLGNYLLVKGKRTYTYIYAGNHAGFGSSPSGYASFYDRRAYHVPIGSPVSPIVPYHGVYARAYSGGITIVNPSPHRTEVVSLGGRYTDLFGRRYRSVTLGPTHAIVLLSASSRRTSDSTRTG
jgi:Hypothetical glycosyl hydrolase family 15